MSLQQFFLILRSRWRLALQIFFGVVALIMAVSLLLPNQYTATASVVADINKPDPLAPTANPTDQATTAYMATQVGIINSDRVVKEVANTFQFDPAFNFHQKWEKSTHGKTDFIVWFAKRLRKALKVAPTGEGNVIEISVKWPDAKASAALANAFAQSYINTNIALRVIPAKQYAGWFDEQSRAIRTDLQAKQQRLADFQNEKGIIPTDERVDIESARLSELSTQLVTIQAQRQDSQSRQQQGTGHSDATPEILQSPLIANLKADLAKAEAKQQNIETSLGASHPEYKSNAAEIDSLRNQIASESQKIIASFGDTTRVDLRREAEISAALEAQKKRVLELRHSRDQAALLQNDVLTAQRNLDAVMQRLAQSSLEGATQQSTVVVLAAAALPDEPSSPNLPLNAVLGVFFGLVLSIGTVLLSEMSDRRIRGGKELEELLTGVPLLGRIAAIGPQDMIATTAPAGLLRFEP
jgi:succinoglycan biosynthesis transport protein ExoP